MTRCLKTRVVVYELVAQSKKASLIAGLEPVHLKSTTTPSAFYHHPSALNEEFV
jgi:hypothetical protein